MSAAHKWLDLENRPTEPLPRDLLEQNIERVLTLTNIGFMATIGKNGPIAQPGRVLLRGLRHLDLPAAEQPEDQGAAARPADVLRRREPDGRLGVGVRLPDVRQRASCSTPHTPEWEHGMTVFKYPSSNWEVGRPIDTVPQGQLLLPASRPHHADVALPAP